MKKILPILLFWSLAMPWTSAAGEEGLTAAYDFRESQGQTLRDTSGHGNHGRIQGATWVPSGDAFALRLDGVDDYVDCGSGTTLNLSQAITVEVWVYPEGVPGAGEPGVVGKSYSSYLLTYYTDGAFWWYIAGGGNRCRASASASAWHHVAGTFDGKSLKLYIDGELADTVESKVGAIPAGGPLLLGVNPREHHSAKPSCFKGQITGVKVYNRALTVDDVIRHCRTTHLTHQIALRPQANAFRGKLLVAMDLRGLGELPAGAGVVLELLRPESATPFLVQRVSSLPSWGWAEATMAVGELAPGRYRLRAAATAGDGKRIGKVATHDLAWPACPHWPDGPKARVLNNLVTELLDVVSASGQESASRTFTNPREGWVFIAWPAPAGTAKSAALVLDGKEVQPYRVGSSEEVMCYLRKGSHELKVSAASATKKLSGSHLPSLPAPLPQAGEGSREAASKRLVVRAVPELVFASFGAHPHVAEFGRYDWAFLSKHVLPNLNMLVGEGYENEAQRRIQPGASRPEVAGMAAEPARKLHPVERWKSLGRRWMVECGVPGLSSSQSVTPEEAFKYWSGHKGMTDPLLDGLIVDEFGGSEDAKYAAWTTAIRKIRESSKFRGKLFYPYCAPMYGAKASREFIQAAMDAGWRFAFERYLPEQRTEAQARAYLQSALSEPIAAWRREMPGAERHMIVCMGTFSQPPESLDVDPGVDHKVFLDMQLNLLANDPGCFGLYGVMTYLSSYTDEETVRWMGKLFRHYAIEGNAEPLARDPYRLPHLENGDFEEGLAGWTVAAAESGSVAAKTVGGLSWLQGRYPPTRQGDTVLWMKQNQRRPNVVSQKVKSLQPGRLYSLRMYSADGRDLSVKREHAVSIALEGGEMLREKCFRHVFANCYSHHYGPFDDKHLAWMNFHWMLFRARQDHATLTISDWPSPAGPGNATGQELELNFVQIQPYY